jgi:small subunit ribosomal protein S20
LANIKSAKKRAKLSEERRQHNVAMRSRVRTFIKKVNAAVEAGDKAAAQELFKTAQSEASAAARKTLFKANKVSRDISRMNARIKAMA